MNISSVVGLAPEFGVWVYGATKAFMLFLSQGLSLELAPKGAYVQTVLPAATATEIWQRSGLPEKFRPPLMEVGKLLDAALVGFDRKESITIPPLHDQSQWETYSLTRQSMLRGFATIEPAERYQH